MTPKSSSFLNISRNIVFFFQENIDITNFITVGFHGNELQKQLDGKLAEPKSNSGDIAKQLKSCTN